MRARLVCTLIFEGTPAAVAGRVLKLFRMA